VSPKRGPFCALQKGSQEVKADCRPSLGVTPIAVHKTTPVLEPIPGIDKNKHNVPLTCNSRKTETQKHITSTLKNTSVRCPSQTPIGGRETCKPTKKSKAALSNYFPKDPVANCNYGCWSELSHWIPCYNRDVTIFAPTINFLFTKQSCDCK